MDILKLINDSLGSEGVKTLSNKLGIKEEQVQSGITSILPVLVGGLAKNAVKQDGANALAGALDKDHDGSILEKASSFLSNGDTGMGDGILKHIFGEKKSAVENTISQQAGISAGQGGQMMAMLAPLVMGAIGKAKKTEGLDASGLAGMLSGLGSKGGGALSQITSLLDKDGDGDVMDDVGGMLSGLFGKK